ncbi:general transcription factor IIE subunit 1 [Carex littledalei]|uniref:General transcription factor IIE subunit 1 n=1 Tax=Carex littledalei TaxID=544730 RepID=A0A833QKK8_9POAL|nr:general transcription factor IIE subunit 1 [Carex littledalei]
MSLEPFNRLVKLAARAFYDDITMKGDNQPKTGRGDNRGIAVVVLDALTRRQWVREEDLAKALKLHSKQLRRILRKRSLSLKTIEKRSSAKGAKIFSAAVAAATGDGHQTGKEGDEKVKMHTHSYCCLDYAQQIYDVIRYRIHKMKKKLKDELDSRNTVQTYICPNCSKRYSAFDALQLISYTDDMFHCERCDGELVAESDKLAADEMGEGDDNRSRRREKLKDLLQRIEEQLKPLTIQLARVKDLPVPDFGTLQQWEIRARAAGLAYGDIDPNDANKSQVPGYGGTPMPSLGDTKLFYYYK